MEKLLEILNGLHKNVDMSAYVGLATDEILDSLDIITIVAEVDDKFDVRIPAEEITPENFDSAAALMALIERLDEE